MSDLSKIAAALCVELTDASTQTVVVNNTTPGASDAALTVRNIPSGTQSVAGTITNVPSGTQPVSGTVTNVPSGTQSVAYGSGTFPVSGTITHVPSGTQTVSGTVTNAPSGTQSVAYGSGTFPVSGTVTTALSDSVSGDSTITTTAASTTAFAIAGYNGVAVNITDTVTATLTPQISTDGSTWTNARLISLAGVVTVNTTSTGSYLIPTTYGVSHVKLLSSGTWDLGTATVSFRATEGIGAAAIQGAGIAGTSYGGVLSIQGVANGVAMPVSGTVTNVPSGTQPVEGTVTNVPSGTQTVDGTITNVPSGTQSVAGTITNVPSGTQSVAYGSGTFPVSGTITNVPSGTQSVAYGSGTFPVSGTITNVPSGTQAVSGTVTASAGALPDSTDSSTITTTAASTTAFAIAGYNGVSVNIADTLTGTLTPQISNDGGTTWTNTMFISLAGVVSSTATTTGSYLIPTTYGISHVKLLSSGTWDSGTATVNFRATVGIGAAAIQGAGIAGTSYGGVLSVQGVANGVAQPVSGTITNVPSGTQPVSGTVTNVPSGTQSVAYGSGTFPVSGTITNVPSGTQPVSGTVTNVPSGTQTVTGTVTPAIASSISNHNQASIGTTSSQLTSAAATQGVIVKAAQSNAGVVYIGSSTSVTTSTGFALDAGNVIILPLNNSNLVWCIASTTSQTVYWMSI